MQWWSQHQLKSKNPETRRQAVEKLVREGADAATNILLELLDDEAPEVRKAVIQGISELQDASAIPSIVNRLRDPQPEIRSAAIHVLARFNDPAAIPAILDRLQDPHSEVRWRAAKALETLGWSPANDEEFVWQVLALGEVTRAAQAGPAALEPLTRLLNDRDFPNRRTVIEALSQIGDARIIKPLLMALKDSDAQVRVASVEALRHIRDAQVIGPLTQALKDSEPHVRSLAAQSLGQSGDASAVEKLCEALHDSNWDARKAAVEALGRLRDPRACEPLGELLSDKDHDVREAVIKSLGELGDERAVGPLIRSLIDVQLSVRSAAAVALARLNSTWDKSEAAMAAIPDLKAALKEKEYWVRHSAAEVLAKITEERATAPQPTNFSHPLHFRQKITIQVLLETLKDYDRDLRLAAVEALMRIGDLQTAPSLEPLLQDPDEGVRELAGRAMESFGRAPGVP